jgi:metal-responsive CopG/Arc/MetJ family transcriptional regulator
MARPTDKRTETERLAEKGQQKISLQLPIELIEEIDEYAKIKGVKRPVIIRSALDHYMKGFK